ncbi:MAG: YDG domain-containing protein, partial [Lentisphaeria bacterium]|nr:YDG domain-containing protein [Lentisphaeria bacterium]
ITPKPVTVSFTADEKTYDGNTAATVHDFVFPGVVAGDALAIADAMAQFAEERVGTWPVTVDAGYTVTGNDDGNYTLSFAEVTAQILAKAVRIGFTAADKEYDGTTAAAVTLLDFTPQLAPVDQGTVIVTVVQAAFAAPDPGVWPVAILDSMITGNDDGNYDVSFADDVEAEIRHNTQVVPSGWSMMVLSLDSLTAESVAAWGDLGVMAFRDAAMQIQRGMQPGYGESFWVFNRDNAAVILHGLKRLDPPAWAPPASGNAWVMTGPPAEDYVVPEGVQVWVWDGRLFVLVPAGGKLPAGNAAWFWP